MLDERRGSGMATKWKKLVTKTMYTENADQNTNQQCNLIEYFFIYNSNQKFDKITFQSKQIFY